ncbi:hypothetical protein H4R99_004822 [Coemansia sp. RSA 1722]|nr:hypothetical protein LPJ57_004584 [Coemansia sp. RSA 486]KAJ2237289.1 hypothetical protein IWW45_001106 [Coemansia sp. RSA 485]KAJ2596693.1 hypothetical protein H4R99_004822 [Coemansia sp. RSA 1722]
MKFLTFVTLFFTSAMAAQPGTQDSAQVCSKACTVAPEDQRETCMRICEQFAEQGVPFAPATIAATPAHPSSSAAVVATPTASNSGKHSASATNASSMMKSGSMDSSLESKSKAQGEDNDEDHMGGAKSGSSAEFSGASTYSPIDIGALAMAVAISYASLF